MEDLVNQTLNESAPKPNRGRFQPGDARINREGRPRGTGCKEGWDRAPRADRLKCLLLDGRDVLHRITHEKGPWIVNFPGDIQIVGCHWNAVQEVVMLVLRSDRFPKIARGALMPEFEPQYNGLRWRR
jgi:hypothetical protein